MKASRFLPLLFVAAPLAQAHPGHGPADLASGFAHPFTGLDHMLAMVAVGIWAVQLGGRARWLLPAGFVGAMTLGAVAGVAGIAFRGAEWGILASVLILGLLIAGAVRFSPVVGMALAACAGFFHGFAHGSEMPLQADTLRFFAGMIAATAILHAAGIAAGMRAARHGPSLSRWAGTAIAAAGILLCLK